MEGWTDRIQADKADIPDETTKTLIMKLAFEVEALKLQQLADIQEFKELRMELAELKKKLQAYETQP